MKAPVLAAALLGLLVPNAASAATTNCNSVTSCIFGNNTGNGHGIDGASANSFGEVGTTTANATSPSNARAGVLGSDRSKNHNVFNSGVAGVSASGLAIYGLSASGYGGYFSSTSGTGVYGTSTHNAGVYGSGPTGGYFNGVSLNGNTGTGVVGIGTQYGGFFASNEGGTGLYAVGAQLTSATVGPSRDSRNSGGGVSLTINSVQDDGGAYGAPVLVINTSLVVPPSVGGYSYDVASIDAAGNLLLSGTLTAGTTPLVRTKSANGHPDVATFTARESEPTIEDYGDGMLVNGVAYVRLDQTFAATIDPQAKYHVVVTPEADSHGVYVTQETAVGFAVRENMGGRSTVAFEYRIVAKPGDAKAARLPLMSAFAQLKTHVRVAKSRLPELKLPKLPVLLQRR